MLKSVNFKTEKQLSKTEYNLIDFCRSTAVQFEIIFMKMIDRLYKSPKIQITY